MLLQNTQGNCSQTADLPDDMLMSGLGVGSVSCLVKEKLLKGFGGF